MFSTTKYRRDIQALRGLAVLAVVLFHAKKDFFPLGYLGVDVFFVISGFVVTPILLRVFFQKGNRECMSELKVFYKRRFYRLAPALVVTLVISIFGIFIFGQPVDHQRFSKQGIATLLLIGNIGAYKYSGDYFAPNPNPLVHTWSLSVEEQFYILLPLILMVILVNRKNKRRNTVIFLSCITFISFISFMLPSILQPIYFLAGIQSVAEFSFYSFFDRIWQFTLGGLGSIVLNQKPNVALKISKSINLCIVFALLIMLFSPIHVSLKASSIIASLIAIATIACFSINSLPNFLVAKLEWLGDRSYSIYLVHMPLLYIAKYSPVTQIGNAENRVVQSILAVAASIFLGSVSYSKIENRFRGISMVEDRHFGNIFIVLLLTFALPLILFLTMHVGSAQKYWGLDRNILRPAYAGDLDPTCDRNTEFGPPCTYSTQSSIKTAMLIGDSHAGHLAQAFVDASKNVNWNAVVWTHSGCRVQFQRTNGRQVSDKCVDINNQIKMWVSKNKPDAIIISQYVLSSLSQKDLRNGISELKKLTNNILLIENVPIFPDGKNFMVSRPLIMTPYNPPKSIEKSLMLTGDKNASDKLAAWARSRSILTMNFGSLFCSHKICTRYADGSWLYRDDNHLSVSGATLTIPQLESYLKRISKLSIQTN